MSRKIAEKGGRFGGLSRTTVYKYIGMVRELLRYTFYTAKFVAGLLQTGAVVPEFRKNALTWYVPERPVTGMETIVDSLPAETVSVPSLIICPFL